MRTNYWILAAAALALVACNKQEKVPVTPEENGLAAIAFDSYLNRGVSTRAGATGVITLTELQTSGFGVFAYYTDGHEYDQQCVPNFMYNQEVSYGSAWTYAPVKYWPNEYGTTAISDDADKVSFFAYAPYVEVVPSTGKLTDTNVETQKWGIVGLSRNSATGDPLVKYIASFDASKTVDLLWGTANPDADVDWARSVGGTDQTIAAGKPWLDVERPASVTNSQAVKFYFQHATAQLNVQIDADPDITAHDATSAIAADTKVYVRSISFTGMATKGALNLNNETAATARWLDFGGVNDLESGETVTIYDGRKDGKEGVSGAVASNEKLQGLNPAIIQGDAATTGVTITPQNLFAGSGATTPVFIIPTGEEIEVEIVYDIETADPNLAGYLSDGSTPGSSIENRIRKTVSFGTGASAVSKFENGKKYTILLHLGMNSVKFDAAVTGWDETTDAAQPWLPSNN